MTIEAAVAVAALVVLFAAMTAGVVTLATYVAAVDAAGAAARAHAIGAPPPDFDGGQVTVTESGGVATATARVETAFGDLRAHAAFPVEHP